MASQGGTRSRQRSGQWGFWIAWRFRCLTRERTRSGPGGCWRGSHPPRRTSCTHTSTAKLAPTTRSGKRRPRPRRRRRPRRGGRRPRPGEMAPGTGMAGMELVRRRGTMARTEKLRRRRPRRPDRSERVPRGRLGQLVAAGRAGRLAAAGTELGRRRHPQTTSREDLRRRRRPRSWNGSRRTQRGRPGLIPTAAGRVCRLARARAAGQRGPSLVPPAAPTPPSLHLSADYFQSGKGNGKERAQM